MLNMTQYTWDNLASINLVMVAGRAVGRNATGVT